ncbi:hypothetical protein GCM10022221_51700 [Actinocorallia aurea]
MTPTETRLRDALTAAAETVDRVPDFAAPARPFRLPHIPRPLAAAIASAAVVGTIAYLAAPDPVPTEAVAPPHDSFQLSVYLCAEQSSNPSCAKKDATAAQRQTISETLLSLPEIRSFDYESKDEAYERFRTLFKDTPGLLAVAEPGDIPDSFRIRTDPTSIPAVEAALTALPGIDQIVNEVQVGAPHPQKRPDTP